MDHAKLKILKRSSIIPYTDLKECLTHEQWKRRGELRRKLQRMTKKGRGIEQKGGNLIALKEDFLQKTISNRAQQQQQQA